MTRIWVGFSFIVIFCVAVFIGVITYWLVWPYKIMEINKTEILTPVVVSGEDLEILLDSTKYSSIPCTVLTEILDTNSWGLPKVSTNMPIGNSIRVIRIRVPANATSGNNYRIHRTWMYEPNPLRKITVETTTLPFTVIGIDAKVQANEDRQNGIINDHKKLIKEFKSKK